MNDSRPARIAVTGASGFVAATLCRKLEEEGKSVLRMSRGAPPEKGRFLLGEDVSPKTLEGVETLVHAAYDFKALGEREVFRANVEGSRKLFDAAKEAGVKRIVFVSTVSAFEGCLSVYGKGKLAVEKDALERGAIVVRPGLVYGEPGKGLFGTLGKLAKLPLLPVFSGGTQPFVLTHNADLAAALSRCCDPANPWEGALFTAAHPAVHTFKGILESAARLQGRTLRTLSVPAALGMLGLKTLEAIGLSIGLRSDSLRSMQHPNPDLDFSKTEELGLEFRPFSELKPEEI